METQIFKKTFPQWAGAFAQFFKRLRKTFDMRAEFRTLFTSVMFDITIPLFTVSDSFGNT